MTQAKDDNASQLQKDAFIEMLKQCASSFTWSIDRILGLRAEHPRIRRLLCPLQAAWFAQTGEVVDNKRVYDVADNEMGLRAASLEITIAADERLRSPYGRRLIAAVGL